MGFGVIFFIFVNFLAGAQAPAAQEVPQVHFQQKWIVFSNGVKIKVDIARTNAERSQGLMFRKNLPKDTGMLFIFPEEIPLGFWMKNTFIPLTIGFFNKKRVLTETLDMDPPLGPVRDEQLPRYQSREPGLYALEVPRGWFLAKKIKPGAIFSIK